MKSQSTPREDSWRTLLARQTSLRQIDISSSAHGSFNADLHQGQRELYEQYLPSVTWPKKDRNMPHFHAIVWIDHLQARIFHIGLSGDDQLVLHPHIPTRHLHHKANSIGNGHAAPDQEFFEEVMNAVSDAGEVLIIGPSTARIELVKHFRKHNSQMAERIVAVEAADHPSDGEIIAYARKYFGMRPPRAREIHESITK